MRLTPQPTILAIDAAWTAARRSGVAFVQQRGGCWHCIVLDWSASRFPGTQQPLVRRPLADPGTPGPLGARISDALSAAGFELATPATPSPVGRQFLEVYPHPALLSLLTRSQRVP